MRLVTDDVDWVEPERVEPGRADQPPAVTQSAAAREFMLVTLRRNLELVSNALEAVAAVDPARIASVSKRQSELLMEISRIEAEAQEEQDDELEGMAL